MEFNEVMNFLKLKEKADKRAEEIFNLLTSLKEFNVSWFMNLSGITYENGSIWFECYCKNEYDEEHFSCDIEYLYMSDDEIINQIKDKREKERKEKEEQEKETARRIAETIAETKEKHDRAEYERLKKKYEKI